LEAQAVATIVVLGMHGGGTSLVAGMLNAAGVAMNPNPGGYIANKRYYTYEDSSFVRLNAAILHSAGGNWKSPPALGDIVLPDRLARRMRYLIETREARHGLWGFKDPRTALTVQLYHPHLHEPRYVVVKREPGAVAHSMATRGKRPSLPDSWLPLIHVHYKRIQWFVDRHIPQVLYVSYDALLDGDREIRRLVEFVGIADVESAVQRAAEIVRKQPDE
jgi:hypothetical protein